MNKRRVDQLKKRLREATRLRRELERRMYHLKTLYDLSRDIGSATDIPSIMNSLLLMVMGTLGAERGVVVLSDAREHRITAVAHRGLDDHAQLVLAAALTPMFSRNPGKATPPPF